MTDGECISLLFGGDFAPLGAYEDVIKARDGAVLGDAREAITRADFTLFNLETPLCRPGQAIDKDGPSIRAIPDTLKALTANGVDAVCLANNHIFDYGASGLIQTMEALDEQGIRYAGAGMNRAAAEAPLRVTLNGRRISIFSFAEREFNLSDDGETGAALLDPIRMVPLLLSERRQAEALIVCVHGGNEYFPWPRPGFRRICQFLIEMGADAVIGHHPHVPGPYEIYHGRPIFYSLGNLLFHNATPPADWDQGYLVRLNLVFGQDNVKAVAPEILPYRQSAAQGGLQLMQGQERDRFLARIEAMRDRLENRPNEWLEEWDRFVEGRARQAEIDMSSPVRFPGLRRLLAFRPIRNLISPPSRRMHRVNLLRCESHRELMVAALETRARSGSL